MTADYRTHDFRPAPAGWFVTVSFRDEDGTTVTTVHPLAGWEVQVWTESDGFGGTRRDVAERRVEPAVWLEADGLVTAAELMRQGYKATVTGPTQEAH